MINFAFYLNEVKMGGWFPQEDFYHDLVIHGYKIETGERDNKTNGEVHWIIESPYKNKYEILANKWDASTFKEILEFLQCDGIINIYIERLQKKI